MEQWQNIYPNCGDIVWTRFQNYKDGKTSPSDFHDQARPYIILFINNNKYYALPLTSVNRKIDTMCLVNNKKSSVILNYLYEIDRKDFTSYFGHLSLKEYQSVVKQIIKCYHNNKILWTKEEYELFISNRFIPNIGDIGYFNEQLYMIIDKTINSYICVPVSNKNLDNSIYVGQDNYIINKLCRIPLDTNFERITKNTYQLEKIQEILDLKNSLEMKCELGYLINYNNYNYIILKEVNDGILALNIETKGVETINNINEVFFRRQLSELEILDIIHKVNESKIIPILLKIERNILANINRRKLNKGDVLSINNNLYVIGGFNSKENKMLLIPLEETTSLDEYTYIFNNLYYKVIYKDAYKESCAIENEKLGFITYFQYLGYQSILNRINSEKKKYEKKQHKLKKSPWHKYDKEKIDYNKLLKELKSEQ